MKDLKEILKEKPKEKDYKYQPYGYVNALKNYINKLEENINYTRCCETLKDEGQATLTEYATELINMQENPQDSNKDWKIVVIQNTIGKLYETLQNL